MMARIENLRVNLVSDGDESIITDPLYPIAWESARKTRCLVLFASTVYDKINSFKKRPKNLYELD